MERYNEYKDSGVQWLGEIPSHWELRKMKYTFCERSQKGFPNEPLLAATQNHGVIKKSDYENRTVEATKNLDTLKLVEKGDFVISLRSFQGGIEYSYCRGIISPAYTVLKAHHLSEPYFKHLAKSPSFIDLLKSSVTGIREGQNIDYNKLKVEFMPIPTIEEQQAIATYLDTITAKIDEAIAQQQKMIDLLNERKQIIINNAVTKGLNPDAPMKDSGVDWIGEIPEHWIITKLKHLVEITDGTHDTPRYVDPSSNTYPLVTSRCIVNGVIDLSLANHITEQDYNYIATRSYVRRNDVIMPMIGTVGNPAIVDFEDSIAIKNVALFRTNGDINIAKFLKYLLNSTVVKEQFAMYNKGGVQNFVSQEILKNLAIIVPDNITDIVGFLEREIAKIETPIIAHNQQISLLQERKQIIINDVVTGKVKVS